VIKLKEGILLCKKNAGGGEDFFLGSQVCVIDIFFHHFIITFLVLHPQNRTFFTGGEANDTMSMHDAQLKLVKYSSGNEEEQSCPNSWPN
jgi:hypothetical protein